MRPNPATTPTPASPPPSLTFRVTAVGCLAPGEQLAVVGLASCPEPLPLATTEHAAGLHFTARPVVVPAGSTLRYRYAVLGPDSRLLRYETLKGGGARLVHVRVLWGG